MIANGVKRRDFPDLFFVARGQGMKQIKMPHLDTRGNDLKWQDWARLPNIFSLVIVRTWRAGELDGGRDPWEGKSKK